MMMAFFSSITGSYILALAMYALIFKILFIPFTIKQQKNQIKMAGLAPKIQLIKAKYKGRTDQRSMQKQQEEIMELQQKEGYNGCSGCLPMLIQLPIIMLLYAVIQSPLTYIASETDVVKEYNERYDDSSYVTPSEIETFYGDAIYKKNEDGSLYTDENGNRVRIEIDPVAKLYTVFGLENTDAKSEIALISKIYEAVYNEDGSVNEGYIADVERCGIDWESVPNFRLFGTNLAETPNITKPSVIIIIPFLAAISSWFSMWLTRKLNGGGAPGAAAQDEQTAKSMKIMDLVMPLMTLFIAFNFSGMLGLYWVLQSILGLIQSLIIAKVMPIPKFTEEQIRELHKQEKEVEKAARAAAKNTRHRSLHYIDEEDYEELPEAPQSESAKKKGTSLSGDAPEIKD